LDKSYEKDEYVKRWLTGLAERSKTNYLREIHEWLDFVDMTPTEQIKKRMHDLTTEDLSERLFFENKFREFKEYLEKKGTLKPDSVKTMLRTVASFFSRNGLSLNLKSGDWKTTSEERAVKRWTPSNEEIKRMYGHANLRDRALLLTLYQSGFSEVDVSSLRIEDLKGIYENPENEHYFIEKKREKSGETQATCLSYECVHDLKATLLERQNPSEGFLFVSTTKGKGDRLEVRSINESMKALAEKTFGQEKAKEFKTKNLRSAYNSALLRANIQPQELKDLLFGHARGSARGHYAYDEITIKEAYVKAFEYLTINGIQTRQDISKLKEEFSATKGELAQLIANQQKQIEKVGAFLSLFMETTDLSEDMKKHYRKELQLLGVSEEIKKPFNEKGVSKIHAEKSKPKEGEKQ
jgi:site-specific recombinase XerC